MKRLVLLLLMLCLLLSGCSILPIAKPKEQTVEEVGITMTIKGGIYLLEDEDNYPGDFTLNTDIGTLIFYHYTDQDQPITYEKLCKIWGPQEVDASQIQCLENGAFFVRLPEWSPGVTEYYYYMSLGSDLWTIQGLAVAANYDEDATLVALQSIQFPD